MRHLGTVGVLALAVLVVVPAARAVDLEVPHPDRLDAGAGEPAGRARTQHLTGWVVAVDAAARRLTVERAGRHHRGRVVVFAVDEAAVAAPGGLVPGDRVRVRYVASRPLPIAREITSLNAAR